MRGCHGNSTRYTRYYSRQSKFLESFMQIAFLTGLNRYLGKSRFNALQKNEKQKPQSVETISHFPNSPNDNYIHLYRRANARVHSRILFYLFIVFFILFVFLLQSNSMESNEDIYIHIYIYTQVKYDFCMYTLEKSWLSLEYLEDYYCT